MVEPEKTTIMDDQGRRRRYRDRIREQQSRSSALRRCCRTWHSQLCNGGTIDQQTGSPESRGKSLEVARIGMSAPTGFCNRGLDTARAAAQLSEQNQGGKSDPLKGLPQEGQERTHCRYRDEMPSPQFHSHRPHEALLITITTCVGHPLGRRWRPGRRWPSQASERRSPAEQG